MAIDPAQDEASSSHLIPAFCLIGVVALLSSITPTMKYVLQHSSLTFLSIASGRIVIGFLFLSAVTACFDGKALRSIGIADGVRFGLLGLSASDHTSSPHTDCCIPMSRTTHRSIVSFPPLPRFSAGAFRKIV